MAKHMLTTADNPWHPFTHWDDWWAYDTQAGHHTNAYLARVSKSSDDLSDPDQELANEMAIDEIVRENPLGLYLKVNENSVIIPTDSEM